MLGTVLYLHGFLSGPTGLKARLVQQECQKRSLACLVPDLNEEPTKVWQQILALLKTYEPGTIGIVASSLGGFYAAATSGAISPEKHCTFCARGASASAAFQPTLVPL